MAAKLPVKADKETESREAQEAVAGVASAAEIGARSSSNS